jgi:hypothetical protein
MSTSGKKVTFSEGSLKKIFIRNDILARVKTFRDASSMAYEPIDVVDYVTIKGKIPIEKNTFCFV